MAHPCGRHPLSRQPLRPRLPWADEPARNVSANPTDVRYRVGKAICLRYLPSAFIGWPTILRQDARNIVSGNGRSFDCVRIVNEIFSEPGPVGLAQVKHADFPSWLQAIQLSQLRGGNCRPERISDSPIGRNPHADGRFRLRSQHIDVTTDKVCTEVVSHFQDLPVLTERVRQIILAAFSGFPCFYMHTSIR